MPIETKRWPEDVRPPLDQAVAPFTLIPWTTKLNPLFWVGNDEGIDPTYAPDWPQWRRALYWYVFRNPLWNFKKYVIGTADRHSIVTGPYPCLWTMWSEWPGAVEGVPDPIQGMRTGWKWAITRPQSGLYPPLPFISYSDGRNMFYLGWQPGNGVFGVKVNGPIPIAGLVVLLFVIIGHRLLWR
jgi:hypothetical protein